MTEKIPLERFKVSLGECYRANDTVYVYTKRSVSAEGMNKMVRVALGLPTEMKLHNVTDAFRQWAIDNNVPTPTGRSVQLCTDDW
jgi:hypothetical protein